MKKIMFFILAVSISIGAAAQGKQSAQNNKRVKKTVVNDDKSVRKHQINERQKSMDRLFNEIPNLTDKQKAELKELQTAFVKENRRVANLINEQKARLKTLQDEEIINQKEVNSTIDEVSALQAEQKKAWVAHRIKVREILTPEQREAFGKFREKAPGRNEAHSGRPGKGHRDSKAQ